MILAKRIRNSADHRFEVRGVRVLFGSHCFVFKYMMVLMFIIIVMVPVGFKLYLKLKHHHDGFEIFVPTICMRARSQSLPFPPSA